MDHAAQGLPQHRSRFRLIALLAVLAIGAAGVFRYYPRPADAADSERLVTLARIVGGHRLTRARLTGRFSYARCQIDSSADRLVRGLVCDGPPPNSWKSAGGLRKFAGYMRLDGQSGSKAPDAHTNGVWNLVWGNADDAVADLRETVRRDPLNAGALNDLAVALTESAQTHDDPSSLIDAFIVADSAVRVDSSLKEARFTHAVLLEQLYLRTDAIDAWKRYLLLDATSPWATEARGSLAALERRGDQSKQDGERSRRAASASNVRTIQSMVAENPSRARASILTQLGAWGTAVVAGDTAKSRSVLDSARALAEPLRTATNDAFMVDAVAAIDRALAGRDAEQIKSLAAGQAALDYGISLLSSREFTTANTRLLEARRLLARGGSPMSFLATLNIAKTETSKNDFDAALRDLRAIRDSARAQYLVLRSNAAQAAALIYDFRSDYIHLVSAYDSAVAEGRTTRDPESDVRVRAWLAPKTTLLHGREAGWRVLYAALAPTPRYPANTLSSQAAFSSAALTTSAEAPRLSLRYSDEVIRIARRLRKPDVIAAAFTLRAKQLAQMQESDLARAAVDSAFVAAQSTSDSNARATLLSDLTLVRGLVALRAAPAEAENALREVVAQYRASDYGRGLTSAYLYLAQSRVASGHLDGARTAFDSAMSVMERERATVIDYSQRAEFLDNARATIDQIVAFRADHGDSVGAFDFFEHTRARVLLEQLTERSGRSTIGPDRPDAVVRLRRLLPVGTSVISYAVLPNEVLIWTVSRSRFTMHRVPVMSADLERLVTQVRQSVGDQSGEARSRAASEHLYQLLIAQAGDLEPKTNLVLIPDKWLHYVPFAALSDARTSRFLVQDHELSYVPSTALLLESLARRSERGISRQASRVLAIGNPKFDAGVFPLANLPASEREARETAAVYQNGSTLIGPEATDVSLEAIAPTLDVLHFAGHAVVRTDAPQMSHLVLAPEGGSEGAVFSSEIARWHLGRMKLVVLSGCGTSSGRISATEGASSLARAFFAAGVPAVIASLWAIDDEKTADFFVAFHRRLAAGEPAATALRNTQLEWIAHTESASTWAAFQFFGS